MPWALADRIRLALSEGLPLSQSLLEISGLSREIRHTDEWRRGI